MNKLLDIVEYVVTRETKEERIKRLKREKKERIKKKRRIIEQKKIDKANEKARCERIAMKEFWQLD